MSLPARPMHIPAGLPIDESTRAELLDVGKANRSNVNVRQTDRGALGKRLGFRALTTSRISGSRTAGRKLFAHNGAPAVVDGSFVDSYSEALSLNVTRSRVPECTYRLSDLPTPSASVVLYDVEHCNGFICVTYANLQASVSSVAVIDASSGAVVYGPATIWAANATVLVSSFGGRYFMAFVSKAPAVARSLFDTLNPAAGWTALTDLQAATGGIGGVCSLGDRVAVAYAMTSGTDRVTVSTYTANLIDTVTVNTSSVSPAAISIDGSLTGTLWVAWSEGTTTKVRGLSPTSLSVNLATTATAIAGASPLGIGISEGSAAGTARVYVSDTGSDLSMCSITTSAGAAVPGAVTTAYNIFPIGRPFQQGGRYYLPCIGGNGSAQASCTFVDWTDAVPYARPIAHVEPGLVLRPTTSSTCKSTAISATKRAFGLQTLKSGKALAPGVIDQGTAGCTLVELDFGSRKRWQTVEHANTTFIGGAILSVYDGERVTEAGFLLSPDQPTATLSATGITATNLRYVAIYEDVDSSGNWVVSGVSTPSATVSPANQTVNVSTSTLSISSRLARGTARVAFYRTASGGEPPYYRLGTASITGTSSTVTFADSVADATLTTRPKLYAPNLPGAASEALDRRAPPGLVHIESYVGMLVGAKGSSIFFSGQEVYGEATWFSPVFEVPITGGGDITAIKAMDGTLFVFKANRVYAITGETPSDNGLAGGLGSPRLLATDVGCIESSSVVVTSLGIFFQSARGIELLTRSQSVELIGDAIGNSIANTMRTYPVVTSAALDARNSLVRFTLATSESAGVASGTGRAIVYDLALQSWISVDDIRGVSVSEPAQSGAMVYLGGAWRYAWLGTDGTVYTERDISDNSAYLDGTNWVTAQYELPPWKLGLQQEQRIYEMELLFERYSAAGIVISVANDYGVYASVDAKVWTEGLLVGQRQVSFRPKPRSTAVQLLVKDIAPAVFDNGRGFAFIGISADIAPKQGPTRGTTRLDPGLRR